jgi:CubicO group peptidase (beta-lactamase class C family)
VRLVLPPLSYNDLRRTIDVQEVEAMNDRHMTRIKPSAVVMLIIFALLVAGSTGRHAAPGEADASTAGGLPREADRVGWERPPGATGPHSRGKDWRDFAAWLGQRARAGAFSGVVLVARGSRPVVMQAGGLAYRAGNVANSADTRFNVGSAGKMFTAVAIAQLVEDGRLSFDDPLGKYVSGFRRDVADRITIGQLLTHTSGLGDVFMRWHPTLNPRLDVSDLMERIVREPLQFEPGSRFAYSNSGYAVLGAVIEAVTGQDYYDYVAAHVFKPAGMTHTGWYELDRSRNIAHGYTKVDTSRTWVAGNPSGGVYSTAGDLLRFARGLLENRLLGPTLTKTVIAGKVDTPRPGPARTRYGYGFEEEFRNGVRIVGNGGGQPGAEAQVRLFPGLGYTAVVLANLDRAARPVMERVNTMLTGGRRRP